MRRRRSILRHSRARRCCAWTASANGRRRRRGWATGSSLSPLWEIPFPHSLGLLYSAFTYYTGFKVNSGEYKVMGLAPYGQPEYVQAIYDHLLDLKPDGTFRLNMDYFNYCTGLTMTNGKFDCPLRRAAAEAGEPADPAGDGSRALRAGRHRRSRCCGSRASAASGDGRHATSAWPAASRSTASPTAGSCAKVRSRSSGSSRRPAMPAARSAPPMRRGIRLDERPRQVHGGKDAMRGAYLGPAFGNDEIERFLRSIGAPYETAGRSDAARPGRR